MPTVRQPNVSAPGIRRTFPRRTAFRLAYRLRRRVEDVFGGTRLSTAYGGPVAVGPLAETIGNWIAFDGVPVEVVEAMIDAFVETKPDCPVAPFHDKPAWLCFIDRRRSLRRKAEARVGVSEWRGPRWT